MDARVALARSPSVPLRTKVAVIVMLCTLVLGAWVWSNRRQPPALGVPRQVVAEAPLECEGLAIEVDGLTLKNAAEVPSRWRGRRVPGELTLTERTQGDGVVGVFVADDGTALDMRGGRTGEVGFNAVCVAWGA